jgi:hypothetical protein
MHFSPPWLLDSAQLALQTGAPSQRTDQPVGDPNFLELTDAIEASRGR